MTFSAALRKFAGLILVPIMMLAAQGCIAQFQEAIRKQGGVVQPTDETATLQTPPAGHATELAAIPETRAEPAKDSLQKPVVQQEQTAQGTDANPTKKLVKPKFLYDLEAPPGEEVVKEAAVKKAQESKSVVNVKICHRSPRDEWWITIYHDLGNIIDVKQFIWNRQEEKWEPFTVFEQISRNKLKVHLTGNKPGSRCEILSPPWTGSGPEDKSDSLSSEFSHR